MPSLEAGEGDCRDEKKCRFCEEDLPDWREGLPALPRANPVMVLTYGGQSYALPGEGTPKTLFQNTLLNLP